MRYFLLFLTVLFLFPSHCRAQDTAMSYFLKLIGPTEYNSLGDVSFPNDSLELSFFGEYNDTLVLTELKYPLVLGDGSSLLYHDSIFSNGKIKTAVWEFRFRLAVDGPHYVGIRIRKKNSGDWMMIKCFCAQPIAEFGTKESPWLQEFESGRTIILNEISFSSPGMPISMRKAIAIAKKEGYYKMHFAWRVEDIRYSAEFRTWNITSDKVRETFMGPCRHTNGCTISHYCSIRISAETGKVLDKSHGHGKTKNYE
ncbi:MAG: hypothetical protein HY064_13935 [Bacteroidetes bacterium]|nr:hypothetical protein [Bacteroidota bacterium]